MQSFQDHQSRVEFTPVSGILAWVLPGLGQYVRGERKRGILIGAGVLGLFFAGLFIGGIDSVDSIEDRPWFYGQLVVGPIALAVDYVHQNHFKVLARTGLPEGGAVDRRTARPDEARDPDPKYGFLNPTPPVPAGPRPDGTTLGPPNRKSLAKVNELGTLYSTIAGMMNLIVIIDAFFMTRRPAGAGAAVQS